MVEEAADRLWVDLDPGPASRAPRDAMLVLASGVPLSGKTTLARALAQATPATLVHVENDAVRAAVVEAMGRDEARFDDVETELTYGAAHALVDRALAAGCHALHDATNLDTGMRERACALADRRGVGVGVVFLVAERPLLEARARRAGPAGQRAHRALGSRDPRPGACTRASIVLEAGTPVHANVERVLADEGFQGLGSKPLDACRDKSPP